MSIDEEIDTQQFQFLEDILHETAVLFTLRRFEYWALAKEFEHS